MFMRPLALAAAIAGLFAANASAAVSFSTLGQSNNAPNGIFDTDYRLASDFKTGGVGASITGITLNMNNSDSVDHTFKVSLYSDAGGSVGSLLTDFSTELIAANTFGAVDKLFTFTGGYSILANTEYWVVLEMLENVVSGGDQPNWSGNSGGGIDGGGSFLEVTSTMAQYSNDGGATWDVTSSDNFLFNIIAVPEPSRAVLAIAGLFVLGFRRRR